MEASHGAQDDNHPSLLRHATVESPASPASPAYSSPLSPVLSELESVEAEPLEQPVNVAAEHGADGVDRATGSSSSSARPTPAAEYTGNDETPTSFACPHCDKSYASEKSFKRHMGDKKSVCFRTRTAVVEEPRWTCPRCDVEMSKKYSVERHIRESCWKICDECCERDSEHCDGHTQDGGCTNCDQAGKLCTKYTAPITDCLPQLRTGGLAQPNNSTRRIKAAAHASLQKRKAVASPDRSPEAKPQIKRKAGGIKQETKTSHRGEIAIDNYDPSGMFRALRGNYPSRFRGKVSQASEALQNARPYMTCFLGPSPTETHSSPRSKEADTTKEGHPSPRAIPVRALKSDALPTASSSEIPVRPAFGSTHRSLLPAIEFGDQDIQNGRQDQLGSLPTCPNRLSEFPRGHAASHMLPSMPSGNLFGVTHGKEYAPSMRELLKRQEEALEKMNRLANAGSSYGRGLHQPPVVPGLTAGVGHKYAGQPLPQSRVNGLGNARSSLPTGFHQNPFDSRRNGPESLVPGLGTSESRATSRQPSMVASQQSAPGPSMSSHQPSRQPSAKQLRASTNSDTDHGDLQDDLADSERLVIKLPLPSELALKLSLSPTSDQQASRTIRIRIHDNTYDRNGDPIFSIFTMLPTDSFGPRLEYYCAKRDIRLGSDITFIYRYPAPIPEKPLRQRYLEITSNTTPAMIKDKEYPSVAIQDGDMIFAMKRQFRLPVPNKGNANESQYELVQVECQCIDIQDGETHAAPMYPDANQAWYKDVENTIAAQRKRMAELDNMIARQTQNTMFLARVVQELETANAQLRAQVALLRDGRLPTMVNAFPDYPAAAAQRRQSAAPNFSGQHGAQNQYGGGGSGSGYGGYMQGANNAGLYAGFAGHQHGLPGQVYQDHNAHMPTRGMFASPAQRAGLGRYTAPEHEHEHEHGVGEADGE